LTATVVIWSIFVTCSTDTCRRKKVY